MGHKKCKKAVKVTYIWPWLLCLVFHNLVDLTPGCPRMNIFYQNDIAAVPFQPSQF